MFKKYLALILTLLVLNLVCGVGTFAQNTSKEKAVKKAAKLKVQVAKLGTGTSSKIEVELTNGSTLKGHISQIDDDTFTIVSDQSGSATQIQYVDAKKISTHHVPLVAKIAGGIVIGFVALVGLAYVLCRTTGCD